MTKKGDVTSESKLPVMEPSNKTGSKIYIGPSLKGVTTGTVYRAGLTPALEAVIQNVPAVSELVVELERLPQANRELAHPDSVLRRIYQMAEKYERGE